MNTGVAIILLGALYVGSKVATLVMVVLCLYIVDQMGVFNSLKEPAK